MTEEGEPILITFAFAEKFRVAARLCVRSVVCTRMNPRTTSRVARGIAEPTSHVSWRPLTGEAKMVRFEKIKARTKVAENVEA
jgi:hypothetical protein